VPGATKRTSLHVAAATILAGKPMANKRYRPEWDYSYTMDGVVSCAFCMTQERPIFVRGGQTIGVCEPCSGIAHFMWKQEPGDVPPSFTDAAAKEVTRVYLVIPRLSQNRAKPHSELPTDYEFVVVVDEEGKLDLPSVVVAKDEKLNVAAVRALGELGLSTWSRPDFLETLYTAYTPRGRLATVMLVRAWRLANSQATSDTLAWRSWDELNKASSMMGFYSALEPVWAMRVFRHNRAAGENPTTDISVRIRSIAAQFIELQQGLREGDKNLDISMFEYMKRKVTEDEKAIDKLIAQHELQSRLLADQKSKDALAAIGEGDGDNQTMIKHPSEGSGGYRRIDETTDGNVLEHSEDDSEGSDSEESDAGEPGEDSSGDEDVGSLGGEADGDEDGEDPSEDEDADDGTEDEDSVVGEDDSPPEGFVRAGRPLSMKPGDE
jgi:hypothetical protein